MYELGKKQKLRDSRDFKEVMDDGFRITSHNFIVFFSKKMTALPGWDLQ